VFCESREDAERVRDQLLPPWLAERGLSLSPEKTRIVHLTEGFDFLGCTVRHYPAPKTSRTGFKLLIKPSKRAVLKKRQELRAVWLGLVGHNVCEVLNRLNPIVRGWAAYYRAVASSEAFAAMDDWMFRRAKRYLKRTHRNKPWKWLKRRYFGKLNRQRDDRWVFGNVHLGYYLNKFGWTRIVRHPLVRGTASPDDPELREYWWGRRKINHRYLTRGDRRLAEAQDWTCPVCGMALFNGEELHRHHRQPRAQGGPDTLSNRELVHLYCHQQTHARARTAAAADEQREP
jgi:RNA-directed DNA polymerase